MIAGGRKFTLLNVKGRGVGVAADHSIGCLLQAYNGAEQLTFDNLYLNDFYGIGLNITEVRNISIRNSELSGSTMSSGLTVEGSTEVTIDHVTASNTEAHGSELTGIDGLVATNLVAVNNHIYNYLIGVFADGRKPGQHYHVTNLESNGAGKRGPMIQGLLDAEFNHSTVTDGVTVSRDDRTQTRPSGVTFSDSKLSHVQLIHAEGQSTAIARMSVAS